ncbi:cytochrome P450 CYP82D47-like [Cryptomeria japonica]|uniref:cytochrome P450 CYP82D47-like n=1 Tax=Cryptomeria japonica TaxID=3369 RepID=UPI0027D9EB3E|nr:cytochrome P450 CYP82D47-like [Cryptomeria japonica]
MDVFTNITFSTMSVIVVGAATLFLLATILLKQHRYYRSHLPPGPELFLCPVLVISSSELAKECFTVNDRSFASRPQLAQAQLLGYNYSMLGWAPYGPYWRNARNIYSIVKMRNVLSNLSFKIPVTMIINERYFGEELGISGDLVTRLIKESFVLQGVVNIGDYIPWLKWLDLQGYEKAMKKVHSKLDLYMQKIVVKHREKGSKDGGEMDDFIDVMISQAEENGEAIPDKDVFIKAIAIEMVSSGTDSVSISLEWALSLLLQHPRVMKKAQEELDSKVGRMRLVENSDIPQLTYLQANLKETMRLYPPGPILGPHKSIEACMVGGYHIPARTILMVNAWAIHRYPKLWNKPLEFIPERFIEKEVELDMYMRGNDFEMAPFGAGRRGCPGASLAICMVQTTLARVIVQTFEMELGGSLLSGKDVGARTGISAHRLHASDKSAGDIEDGDCNTDGDPHPVDPPFDPGEGQFSQVLGSCGKCSSSRGI